MLKLFFPLKIAIHFMFNKKQSTCTYIRTHLLLKDAKVKHLCREQTTTRVLHSVQNEVLKVPFYSSNLIPGISVLTQTNTVIIFYIFPKVNSHGNICLKVNKKFTNIASSSDVLPDFWFLNCTSTLFTKTTPKDSNEQNSVTIVRQHSMDRRCFSWQMQNSKFLLY